MSATRPIVCRLLTHSGGGGANSRGAATSAPRRRDGAGGASSMNSSTISSGGAAAAGTAIVEVHLGHLTFFPAAASGALRVVEQLGQVTTIGMAGL